MLFIWKSLPNVQGGPGHCCSSKLHLPSSLKPSIRLSMVEDVNIAPFWTQKDLRDVVFRFLREAAHSRWSNSAWGWSGGGASGGARLAVCDRDLRLARLPAQYSSLRAGYEGDGRKLSSFKYRYYQASFFYTRYINFKSRGSVFYSKYLWVFVFLYNRKLPLPSHVTAIAHKT